MRIRLMPSRQLPFSTAIIYNLRKVAGAGARVEAMRENLGHCYHCAVEDLKNTTFYAENIKEENKNDSKNDIFEC
jgi:hypothetical protein